MGPIRPSELNAFSLGVLIPPFAMLFAGKKAFASLLLLHLERVLCGEKKGLKDSPFIAYSDPDA